MDGLGGSLARAPGELWPGVRASVLAFVVVEGTASSDDI